MITRYFLYFLISGFVVTCAALLAERDKAFLGGLLMVLPNMSLIAFYFINKVSSPSSTMIALKSSLLGTIIVWPAYMLVLMFLIPKIGVNKSLITGFVASIIMAIFFIFFCKTTIISNWINSF